MNSYPASDRFRRTRLLNIIATGMMVLIAIVLVGMVAFYHPSEGTAQRNFTSAIYAGLSSLIVCALVLALNRWFSVDVAAIVFLTFLVLVISLSDDPHEVIDGRNLIVFAIPILAASFLIRSWVSFIFAGLSSLAIFLVGLQVRQEFPNLVAMATFFTLAMLAWSFERGLDRAIRAAQASNVKLQESEEKYRVVSELTSDFAYTFRVEPDGSAIPEWVTEAFTRLTGFTLQYTLEHGGWESLVHPADRSIVQNHTARLWECQEDTAEFRMVTKSGKVIWIRSYALPILDETKQRVIRIYGAVQDITARKQAEKALRESEELYRTLAEAAQDLIFIINRKDVVEYVNGIAARQFDRSPQEIVGKRRNSLFPPEVAEAQTQGLDYVFKTGQTAQAESKTGFPGHEAWLDTILVPIKDERGGVRAVLGVSRDITERKHADDLLHEYSERLQETVEERTRELRQAQKELVQKERLAVLGELAGGIAHELRNPLGVISNATYYLGQTLPDANKETREYLDILQEEVRSAERIVTGLLNYAHIQPPKLEPVEIASLIDSILEFSPPPHRVTVHRQISSKLPVIQADANQLQQILHNLIQNAFQAMPKAGTVTIKSRFNRKKHNVRIEVIDNGVGILSCFIPRIFDPLFTTKAKGIGLGLSVAKSLAENNGGMLEVRSKPGKGSTFSLILPVN